MLTILSVAYPFARVGPDAVGGAEQILTFLDEGITRNGHRSIVIAPAGSLCRGELIEIPHAGGRIGPLQRDRARGYLRTALAEALSRYPVDVIHMHGVDFSTYLPNGDAPILVTLHLPPDHYAPDAFATRAQRVFMHCVSASQERACPSAMPLLAHIGNGVPDAFMSYKAPERGNYAVALGRICPEKGFHLALDAAERARIPLVLGGAVFPYEEHRRYFDQEITPRLNAERRWIGPVGLSEKMQLIAGARCVLIPSLVAETSSVVAMESCALGTPVIALRSGALPEIVEHGRTGFIVDSPDDFPEAIAAADTLDPDVCRSVARARFSAERMVQQYIQLYHALHAEHDVALVA